MNSLDVTPTNGQVPPPAVPASPGDYSTLNQLLITLAHLVETAGGTSEFLPTFLDHAIDLTQATGAALWLSSEQHGTKLLAERHLERTGLHEGNAAWVCHTLLLKDASLRTQAFWVPPHTPEPDSPGPVGRANLTRLGLLLAPVIIEKQVVAVLEFFQEANRPREEKRFLAQVATQLAGFAAAHFHKSQRRDYLGQRQLWEDLESFSLRVHKTLNPEEVAYLAANDGKKLLECDQVVVGICRGGRCQVEAVSGAVRVDRRGPLVRSMQALLRAVADWGNPLSFEGSRDDQWPPEVLHALDNYLVQSNGSRLVVLPLKEERGEVTCLRGILLAEFFAPSAAAEQLRERMNLLSRHVTPALGTALEFERLPLKWLTRPLAHLRDGLLGNTRYKLLAAVATFLTLVGVLSLVRVPLRIQATGQLTPSERRIVYAPLNGKILQLLAQHGDRVEKGQELLFLEDPETQLKVSKLSVGVGAAKQKIAFLEEQLAKVQNPKERAEFLAERIKTQYELQKAIVERDLILAECRNPQKAPVFSPLAGQLLTFDAREKLLGKEVKVGEPLLRVAATEGTWEVELFLPERDIGTIRAALAAANESELVVDLLLSSDPQRTYTGKLSLTDLGGETQVRDSKVVLPVRVQLNDRALITQLERMPVGVEVRAKINCGHAALGFVWFGEIWDFVYEKFLF